MSWLPKFNHAVLEGLYQEHWTFLHSTRRKFGTEGRPAGIIVAFSSDSVAFDLVASPIFMHKVLAAVGSSNLMSADTGRALFCGEIRTQSTETSMHMSDRRVTTDSGELSTGSPVIRAAEKSAGREILDT